MGVHDTDKYPEVKRLLGIPEDEPIFIFRAQDILMPYVIDNYREAYVNRAFTMGVVESEIGRFTNDIDADLDAIAEWQNAHKDTVKVPD